MNSPKCMTVFLNLHEKQDFLGFSTLAFTSKTLQGTVWLFSVFWAESLEAGAEHTPLGAVTPSSRLEVALVLQAHVTAVCEQESRHAALPAGVWSQHRGSTLEHVRQWAVFLMPLPKACLAVVP